METRSLDKDLAEFIPNSPTEWKPRGGITLLEV